jgi:ferredoxin, 2Fe-2S
LPIITFLPSGLRLSCEDGATVYATARLANLAIPTACNGKATCGLCRVKIIAGEKFLPPLNADEKKHLGNVYFITKLRLSCQATVTGGDVTVEIPGAPPAQGKTTR